MTNEQNMEKIRRLARELMRTAALLITTETPKDAYDALHALQEKAEALGIVFDEFDEDELGFDNHHVRKMTPIAETVEKGDSLLRSFERPGKSPMPGVLEHLAC